MEKTENLVSPTHERLMRSEEAASFLGIKRGELLRHTRLGFVTHLKIGGSSLRYQRSHLEAFKKRYRGLLYETPESTLERFLEHAKDHLNEYKPIDSCVYFLVCRGRVVYVGQAFELGTRVKFHLNKKSFDRIFYIPVSKSELDEVEGTFIRYLKPFYNLSVGPNPKAPQKILERYGIKPVEDA